MFEHVQIDLREINSEDKNGKRIYTSPEGINLPSITTVLSLLSREGIAKWRKKVGEEEANKILFRASTRGTAVHEIVEKYINNEKDFKDGYTPDIISTFSDIRSILDNRIGRIYAQEAPLYSLHLGVAGRVDCIAEFDGRISVIDFKTSRKPKQAKYITNYFMQEAAYSIMWEERTGMPITQLVTIIAVDNNEPQVFIEHRDNWVRPLKETIAKYEEENSTILFV